MNLGKPCIPAAKAMCANSDNTASYSNQAKSLTVFLCILSLLAARDAFTSLEDPMRVAANTVRAEHGLEPLASDLSLSRTALDLARELGTQDNKEAMLSPEVESKLLERARANGFTVGDRSGMWRSTGGGISLQMGSPSDTVTDHLFSNT